MGHHPNAVALRKGYAAFAAGDMDTVSSLFGDDIAWHQAGNSPLAGDLAGKDAVFGTFAQLVQLTAGTFGQEDPRRARERRARGRHGRAMVGAAASVPGQERPRVAHDGRHRPCGLAGVRGPAAADAALTP